MAEILIASGIEGAAKLKRILQGHECTVVSTMSEAIEKLDADVFDLIIIGLHFDESRMFDLMREITITKKLDIPIICFCSRDTPISRLMHESLEISTKELGAWMYLAEHTYNVYQDPNAELRRIMERCLTEEMRKEIQLQRLDLDKRRTHLQQVRMLLQDEDWSPLMKKQLAGLSQDLDLLRIEVERLHTAADVQSASVVTSRDHKDRVAKDVTIRENKMSSSEDLQSASEFQQSATEDLLSQKEDDRESEGRNILEQQE